MTKKAWTVTLCLGLFCSTASTIEAEFSFKAALEALIDWGNAAHGYSETRWAESRDALLDNLVGSTIHLRPAVVDASMLRESGSAAVYASHLDKRQLSQWNAGGLSFAKARPTNRYARCTLTGVSLRLTDDSSRMSMELGGISKLDVLGRISDAGILQVAQQENQVNQCTVWITIDVITWFPM